MYHNLYKLHNKLSCESHLSRSTCQVCRAMLFNKFDTAKMHGLDTSNMSSHVMSRHDEPSGIWAILYSVMQSIGKGHLEQVFSFNSHQKPYCGCGGWQQWFSFLDLCAHTLWDHHHYVVAHPSKGIAIPGADPRICIRGDCSLPLPSPILFPLFPLPLPLRSRAP